MQRSGRLTIQNSATPKLGRAVWSARTGWGIERSAPTERKLREDNSPFPYAANEEGIQVGNRSAVQGADGRRLDDLALDELDPARPDG